MAENKDFNVDDLLKKFLPPTPYFKASLKELFETRIEELKISINVATNILGIQYRTLNGILNGSQKTVDFSNLIKIANFLQISNEKAVQLYVESLEKNFKTDDNISADKVEFIKNNFDLGALKKAKVIDSITDFAQIEKKVKFLLGLNEITDYKKPSDDVAFSAGIIKPKNGLNRSMWIDRAAKTFEQLGNPYEYDREALIKYFPEIRWHSTNVEAGLIEVIKSLYKIGITVIYQSPLPSLHLKGATFKANYKPCVVLTNYRGYYPTLWFALIHELYHVLFDWDELKNNEYHLSDDDDDRLTVQEKEDEANKFAREYLFSIEKTASVKAHLYNGAHISEFAKDNHVHASFIYVFNAYDQGSNRSAWALANKTTPNFDRLIEPLDNPWDAPMSTDIYIKSLRKIYN